MPIILGIGGVLALLGIGGVVLLIALSSSDPPAAPAPAVATAVAPPKVDTPAPAPDGGVANPNGTASGTAKGGGTVAAAPRQPTTATPLPTATPRVDAGPGPLGPFPRAKAQAEVDRVGSSISSCKKSAGPFGGSSIRVDFEPDGRVGTVTRPPFAGTPEGSCISAKFLAIRIGPFVGSTQSIEHGFIIQD